MVGRLLDGRYQIRARIARGGMATVYLATDLRLERRVAVKVMHAHLADDAAFRDRFIQEARSAARLAHPNVVNVFDQGQDLGTAYLVTLALVSAAAQTLVAPYTAGFRALLYIDQRMRTEGLDVALQAAANAPAPVPAAGPSAPLA